MAVTLTTSYQYIGRTSAKAQSGSGSYYLLLYAKSTPNKTTGIHTVTVQTKLASNYGTFYGYSTTTSTGTINGTQAFSVSKMPNAAWKEKNPIAADVSGGTDFKQSFTLGTGSIDVDCTNGLAKDIAIQGYYYFNHAGDNYTPSKGQKFTVNATVTLPAIPRAAEITAANDFTDEDNPTITINNVMGNNATKLEACIAYQGSDGVWTSAAVPYREITNKTATSYTFNLTDTERNALRAQAPNSTTLPVTFYLKTTIGENTFTKTLAKTMTIVNALPSITWSSVEEKDADILKSEIKDLGMFLKGVSDVQITVTPITKKSATLKSVKYTHNGASLITNPATFTNVLVNNFECTVTDSRGYSATSSHTIPLLDYTLLNASQLNIYRDTAIDPTKILLDATINYFNSNFAEGIPNTIELVLTNSSGVSQTITDYTTEGNVIHIDGIETIFTLPEDQSDSYTLTMTDKVMSVPATRKVSLLIPTLEMGQYDVQVNGTLYIADNARGNIKTVGKHVANELYPVGSIYITVDGNFKPGLTFGGTWESFGAGRTIVGVNTSDTDFATVEKTGGHKELQQHTHTITVDSKTLTGSWKQNKSRFGGTNTVTGIVSNIKENIAGYFNETGGTDTNTVGISINATHNHTASAANAGSGTGKNLQPYITVYMWKRIG